MFALEIDFRDGISPPETILVRRSNAIVGSSELAHVVVEGAASSLCELRLIRGLGREFVCVPVRRPGQGAANPPFLEGSYPGDAEIRLGNLSFHVTALDIDLNLTPDEFPDRAAVRILRRAVSTESPVFPSIAVIGAQPMFISFPAEEPLLIGRSRKCGLRLDASDVSGEHARMGVDDEKFWVEDLGSTNGTFVGSERISGRRYLAPGELVMLGSEFSLMPIANAEDVARLNSESKNFTDASPAPAYPCLVTKSETIRPVRFALKAHQRVAIGRDPANDIWANYPHISRNHVEVIWTGEKIIRVIDRSSNGTYIKGQRLPRGRAVELTGGLAVLDLCSGVELAVCANAEEENEFFHGPAAAHEEVLDSIPTQSQSAADIRAVLEKAAGIAEEIPHKNQEISDAGAFSRLVERQSNFAQKQRVVASEQAGRLPFKANTVAGSLDPRLRQMAEQGPDGLSDFERYQIQRRQSGPENVQEFDPDYALIAEAEFDEESFGASQFGGTGKLLIMGLVVLLISVVLVLCVSFFGSPFFVSFD